MLQNFFFMHNIFIITLNCFLDIKNSEIYIYRMRNFTKNVYL